VGSSQATPVHPTSVPPSKAPPTPVPPMSAPVLPTPGGYEPMTVQLTPLPLTAVSLTPVPPFESSSNIYFANTSATNVRTSAYSWKIWTHTCSTDSIAANNCVPNTYQFFANQPQVDLTLESLPIPTKKPMPGVEPTPVVEPTPEVVLMPGFQHFSLLVRVNTLINNLVPLALCCWQNGYSAKSVDT
jgi:hypothetical protein